MGRGAPDRRRKLWRKTRATVRPGFGDRIRALREHLGLTQAQLGDGVLSGSYISNVENEVVRPSVAALDLIARKLGTTAVALGMVSDASTSIEPLTALSQALGLVRAMATTDERQRKLVEHLEWVLLSAVREVAMPPEDLAAVPPRTTQTPPVGPEVDARP